VTKAKIREEFVKAWEAEFDVMAMLSESLPTKDHAALEYLSQLRALRLRYIALAANETYGGRFCRYCGHMKDCADGQTGANAPGFHCELDLVKPETGDLTAATCPEYMQEEDSDIKAYFRDRVGRSITKEELEKVKLYLSNEERDRTDPIVRNEAVDYLIKNWFILEKERERQEREREADPDYKEVLRLRKARDAAFKRARELGTTAEGQKANREGKELDARVQALMKQLLERKTRSPGTCSHGLYSHHNCTDDDGREHDATDDLPASEEERRDYGQERGGPEG
jgi:hypothetical protein